MSKWRIRYTFTRLLLIGSGELEWLADDIEEYIRHFDFIRGELR